MKKKTSGFSQTSEKEVKTNEERQKVVSHKLAKTNFEKHCKLVKESHKLMKKVINWCKKVRRDDKLV